jgi:hypothetical protein
MWVAKWSTDKKIKILVTSIFGPIQIIRDNFLTPHLLKTFKSIMYFEWIFKESVLLDFSFPRTFVLNVTYYLNGPL